MLWVERSVLSHGLRLTVVYDDRLTPRLKASGPDRFELDDVEIRLRGVPEWVPVEVRVVRGVLAVVDLVGVTPLPKQLHVDEWRYRTGEPSPLREGGDPKAGRPEPPAWLEPLLADASSGVVSGRGARPDLVSGLPLELAEFLQWSDGATLWGAIVLPAADLYRVEADGRHLLVFSQGESGSASAIALDDRSAPVIYLDAESGDLVEIAPSFRDWVLFVREEAAALGRAPQLPREP